MRSVGLTVAQRNILDVYADAASNGERPPTLRDLCDRFRWSSTATARDHVAALVRKGFLRKVSGARNYQLAGAQARACAVPRLGTVSAGRPLLAVEHMDGWVTVPAGWDRGAMFAVRVSGDSMIGAGMLDGDTIVARVAHDAADGEIVVARRIDEVTVKRLRRRGRTAMLVAENPRYEPIPVDEETTIDGVVVGLLREIGTRRGKRGTPWAH
jgi:repressor LexA